MKKVFLAVLFFFWPQSSWLVSLLIFYLRFSFIQTFCYDPQGSDAAASVRLELLEWQHRYAMADCFCIANIAG